MSVLGFGWTPYGVWLSVRPDPARPPCRLDGLCRCDLPQTIDVPVEVIASGRLAGHQLLQRWFAPAPSRARAKPAWLTAALARYFQDVFHAVRNDPDLQVLLLGELDQFVIVVPPHARPSDIQALRTVLPTSPLTVTVVAHHTAAMAGLMEAFVPQQPFLACDWEDDLVVRPILAHDTLCHIGQTGNSLRLRDAGRTALERCLLRAVLSKGPVSTIQNRGGAPQADLSAGVAAPVAAFVERALAGGDLRFSATIHSTAQPGDPAPAVRVLPPCKPASKNSAAEPGTQPAMPADTASHAASPWKVTLSEDEVTKCWAPLFERAGNFLRATLREARRAGLDTATLSGCMFDAPRLSGALPTVLEEEGFHTPPGSPSDAVVRGLHFCVRARPMLPYDCGVLLKSRGAPVGIGTLLLVRPASIGEERQSDILSLPVPADAALEVAFYLRRLNANATRVICEVMKSHSFAPALNAAREARLRVAMRVDQEAGSQPAVSVDILDLNANQHIRFERLPLTGTVPLRTLPLREARQLKAAPWAEKIHRLRASIPPDKLPRTVDAWRRLLESGPQVSRQTYAKELCGAAANLFEALAFCYDKQCEDFAKGVRTQLMIELFWKTAEPAEIQAEARRLLFQTMQTGAGVVAKAGGNHCAAWQHAFPASAGPPPGDTCARRFLTAVSQDLAGLDFEAAIVGTVEQVLRMYHLATCSPLTLNVAWDGSLD
ncbi:MAG TPA: hypothetical protein P5555_08795 [Candidatus Paceibacterota bacterium]|nr:hypothetical protein [Verrucomicrobiota bacterium]HRZ45271.1 hypothetical protein [Candidatus Paceibacterota bacterium]